MLQGWSCLDKFLILSPEVSHQNDYHSLDMHMVRAHLTDLSSCVVESAVENAALKLQVPHSKLTGNTGLFAPHS